MNVIPFEYQGKAVRFSIDGWINATEIAKRHGKRLDVWLKSADTKNYFEALSKYLNTTNRWDLIKATRGNNGGTWLHPKLAVKFARWISVDFELWCDMHIDTLLHGDQTILQHQLSDQEEKGSKAGRELADHRWKKPPLLARVHHLEESLQMKLELAQ